MSLIKFDSKVRGIKKESFYTIKAYNENVDALTYTQKSYFHCKRIEYIIAFFNSELLSCKSPDSFG
jgi:hypothetical protein